jgi:universal stress protein A
MKFKRILCGVDFSQASVLAFDVAVELARLLKAELHIMHVIEAYPVVPGWVPVRDLDDTTTALEEKAQLAMAALIETASKSFNGTLVTTEVTRGRAYVEVLHRAHDRDVDLIVLGARGLALPEEAVTGSTAERVVKEATCSVMVVRG